MTGDVVRLIARWSASLPCWFRSAIGWYGLWQDQVPTESRSRINASAMNCSEAWEQAARPAAEHGVRVNLRIGLVLGTDGGFITRHVDAVRIVSAA